jgi:molybdopterin converting factor small subunit
MCSHAGKNKSGKGNKMKIEHADITVKYYGHLAIVVNCSDEKMSVPVDLYEGVMAVKRQLAMKYGIESGYMTMINGESLTRVLKQHQKKTLTNNDTIEMIPMVSGG